MAVLSIEIFASTGEDAEPMSPEQQYGVRERFTHALMPLKDGSRSTLLINFDVTAHETGAFITALCLADTGTTAAEAIAEHLTTSLNESTDLEDWQLRAGVTHVISSDN